MFSELDKTITAITPEIQALRHEYHRHPEVRFEEEWTSNRIAQFLDGIDVPYKRGYAKGTGIVATIAGEGDRTVALRADIDALEIQEETDLIYASEISQRMHACGHDGHNAILCGTAKALAQHRDLLKGTVRLIFQPGEEEAAGGRYMVEEGALDGVDAAFALHGWPTLPVGSVGLREGNMLASADVFHITIRGKGCHAADPASGVDPVLVGAHIITNLQTIVSREVDPNDPAVVSVTCVDAGTATNIIPETARVSGTFRCFSDTIRDRICESIKRVAKQTAIALRAHAEIEFSPDPYPPLINDPTSTAFLRETAEDLLGADKVVELEKPFMGAEDFAFYLRKVPGAFVCLGVNPSKTEPYPPLHNPRYNFTDEAVPVGVRLMANLAVRYLTETQKRPLQS
jgi:hippurate hydrolase